MIKNRVDLSLLRITTHDMHSVRVYTYAAILLIKTRIRVTRGILGTRSFTNPQMTNEMLFRFSVKIQGWVRRAFLSIYSLIRNYSFNVHKSFSTLCINHTTFYHSLSDLHKVNRDRGRSTAIHSDVLTLDRIIDIRMCLRKYLRLAESRGIIHWPQETLFRASSLRRSING